MIEYERFTLKNGLRVLFHQDKTTPLCVVNTLYDVGARDEMPERTGFAHLFEHLMFGGSINIPDFDKPLQQAGGSNNAFTNNDYTNYYDIIPVQNIETALWLESDRMCSLAFTPKSLEVQRNVVIEEFKQRYLNQPYGDLWLHFRPLAYKVHPYQWATIGKNIKHIEDATMKDVKKFFKAHYHPGNAILCIAGNLTIDKVKTLTEKWYGSIPALPKKVRNIPKEPQQTAFRTQTITQKVPADLYVYGFKMPGRGKKNYAEADLLSDILGRGKSSRLYTRIKKELGWVTEISAYITGTLDDGLLVITASPSETATLAAIDQEIQDVIKDIQKHPISSLEFTKILNKAKTTKAFAEEDLLNRSMELCLSELLGNANLINTEMEAYEKATPQSIQNQAKQILSRKNCSRLIIKAADNDK